MDVDIEIDSDIDTDRYRCMRVSRFFFWGGVVLFVAYNIEWQNILIMNIHTLAMTRSDRSV